MKFENIQELIDGYSKYSCDQHDIINTVTGVKNKIRLQNYMIFLMTYEKLDDIQNSYLMNLANRGIHRL